MGLDHRRSLKGCRKGLRDDGRFVRSWAHRSALVPLHAGISQASRFVVGKALRTGSFDPARVRKSAFRRSGVNSLTRVRTKRSHSSSRAGRHTAAWARSECCPMSFLSCWPVVISCWPVWGSGGTAFRPVRGGLRCPLPPPTPARTPMARDLNWKEARRSSCWSRSQRCAF